MLLRIDRCVSVKDVSSHEFQEEEDEEPRNGRYTLKSVKKIDHYSRYKILSGFKTKRFFLGGSLLAPTSPLLCTSSSDIMQLREPYQLTSWSDKKIKHVVTTPIPHVCMYMSQK